MAASSELMSVAFSDKGGPPATRRAILSAMALAWSSIYNKSIRSTTPTIAESIAAPTFPVAAVEALQPS